MSSALSRLKSVFVTAASPEQTPDNKNTGSLEPEVGFKLSLDLSGHCGSSKKSASAKASGGVPELSVHLIGARHLPSLFGFKSVQGYIVKVKLFPGNTRYDSNISTSSWPKFDEDFKFPLVSQTKSSIKTYSKEFDTYETLPAKYLQGQFVVFTVFALLELPANYGFNRFKGTYRSLRSKGTALFNSAKNSKETEEKTSEEKPQEGAQPLQLTKSEMNRNIGSVSCFLEPKMFKEYQQTKQFLTEEMWLPIKDITVTPTKTVNVNNSPKGQIELILEISDADPVNDETNGIAAQKKSQSSTKKQLSLSEIKRKMKGVKVSKQPKGLCLKLTTSKMRCSIKVKEEFESAGGLIYVKTNVFEHNILSNSWKSDMFLPSISVRWDPNNTTIIIPLADDSSLQNVSIQSQVAAKTKVGKKILLGSIQIGPLTTGTAIEHWRSAIQTKNEPVAMWHNFQ